MKGVGLLHAVSVGAFALLVLKVVGLWAGPARLAPPAAEVARAAPAAPAGRVALGNGPALYDPETTGSVAQAAEGTNAGASGTARPATVQIAQAPAEPPSIPAPQNRAGIFEGQPQSSPAERALYERLGERRSLLEQRATDLDTREKLLQGVEKKLETSIQDLKASEDKLLSVKKQEAEATQTVKTLVTMYEVMKPRDAARVFDRLPHEVLVPVVLQMNPRKMAEVLAAMSPEAAEKLTVALAARGNSGDVRTAAPLPPNELPALPR